MLQIVVAVGYFSDYELAKTSEGTQDNNYSDQDGAMYPMINLYPASTSISKTISYYVIRQNDMALKTTFLDVAVL